MIVVSDTSPLCYLLLIDLIEVLPQLFERVIIPQKGANLSTIRYRYLD
jgi:predicted nucleic acid-binding protein